jgi:di/tricarboxylate transporter
VLVTIAAAFGIGTALQSSGAATAVAQALVSTVYMWGPLAVLAAVYLMGAILTEIVTNNAAAALLFPICLESSRLIDADPRPFLMALLFAASASFITPIGYQTNMMVYGTGGYRFADFAKFGTPLSFVLWLVAILLIPRFWPF